MLDVINILLVDDQQRNLDALEVILDDPGYRLLRADDADKALRLLLEHDVAAIVLDIKMPGISGLELASLIKGTKKFRQIPIVFLTAYMVDDQDVLSGYGAGAVDYLTKPVNPQILRHKISVFATLFRTTRALAQLNETLEARVQERTAKLEASEAALRASSEQKDAFLATLAHELRNPLAPLRTGLDLLLQMPRLPGDAARVTETMTRQLDHMVRLIDDLLDVTRVTRGMLELKKQRANLVGVLEDAVEMSRPSIVQRGQTITVRASGPTFAIVDATRICQIVSNLLHNASKYTPAAGDIRVELEDVAGTAQIRVIDTGAGIPADQIERVFDMFARIERSVPHSAGGLGIGLALSRRLAELHDGSLHAMSRGEGHGATFTLSIPGVDSGADPGAESMAPAEPSSQPGDASTPAMTALDIVLIEDNEDSADILAMWLEGIGHNVHIARTGPDGLAMVLSVRPQLVLCDIGLPGMDGVEICRRLMALDLVPRPLMVALTGWGMEADRQRSGEAGFTYHLVKPVALEKLREVLSTVKA
ncbi:MAG TPA: response regulator [Kofleriaceae bacterium]|jgi:signal transduction histidine kinase|nr:response regulator [Kofleriaceae bacterium]